MKAVFVPYSGPDISVECEAGHTLRYYWLRLQEAVGADVLPPQEDLRQFVDQRPLGSAPRYQSVYDEAKEVRFMVTLYTGENHCQNAA